MRYGRYAWSFLFLRCGIGIVFAWIGIDALRHPDAWIGFLPSTIPTFGLLPDTLLKLGGIFDIVIGVLLVLGAWLKIAAFLGALHLVSVLFSFGVDQVLIRDVGLLGGLLALAFWPSSRRWHLLPRFFRHHKSPEEY